MAVPIGVEEAGPNGDTYNDTCNQEDCTAGQVLGDENLEVAQLVIPEDVGVHLGCKNKGYDQGGNDCHGHGQRPASTLRSA